MEITSSKEALIKGIQVVQNAVSQKSSLPILNNVLLEAQKDELQLTATDLDIGICSTVPVELKQAGAITIPARKFFDIVKNLPDGSRISMAMKKNNFVVIKSGKSVFKVIGLPREEFPQLPAFKDKDAITLEQNGLKRMFDLTDFAVSRDDTRFVLNGIFLSIKDGVISMVATDGRRLAVNRKKLEKKTLIDREVVIPTKAAQEVKRMLADDGTITIKFGDTQVLFEFPDSFVLSRVIEGEYPNYRNVIPEKSDKEVKVSREDFLAAARRASIFTDQDSLAIKLNIGKDRMTISKNTPYLGESKEELAVDYTGTGDLEIGFNPKYLMDVLKNLAEEEIVLEVNGTNKPGVVRLGEEYTYVVLPMQLNS